MSDLPRTVLAWSSLGPYHIARLRALADVLPSLDVIQVYEKDSIRPWVVDPASEVFRLHTLATEITSQSAISKTMLETLNYLEPEILIVSGVIEPAMRSAAQWARRRGVPIVSLWASCRGDKRRFLLKEWVKKIYVTQLLDAVACTGIRAADYVHSLGFSDDQIWRIGNVVDNEHFAHHSQWAREHSEQVRQRIALPQEYILYVGRLSVEKNLIQLLDAFKLYKERGGKYDLVIVGDGPAKAMLKTKSADASVNLIPWLQYNQLPYVYGLAKGFVLPSVSESWGLVVNEAMAAGLPVLVSRKCGCVPELCRRGINGYDFDPFDIESIADALLWLSQNTVGVYALGEASRSIVADFTPKTWSNALVECLKKTSCVKAKVGR